MDEKRVAEAVTKRAQEKVDEALRTFKARVESALGELGLHAMRGRELQAGVLRALAGQLDGSKPGGGYPKVLWDDAEKAVLEDVLRAMDPLQRALRAKGGHVEGEPAAPAVEP